MPLIEGIVEEQLRFAGPHRPLLYLERRSQHLEVTRFGSYHATRFPSGVKDHGYGALLIRISN
jgi:hypothetical protein